MRDYDYKLCNISKWRQRELVSFCRQYPALEAELRKMSLISGRALDGMPRGNELANPTEKIAIRVAYIKDKLEMIDKAMSSIEDMDYVPLVKLNLCYCKNINQIRRKYPWVSHGGLYRSRREALIALDKLKNSP